jgi:hypothetical protein
MSLLKDKLYESLNEVAKAVLDGKLSDSSLIKASEIYKWRTSFKPDSKYNLIKAKTFNNFINGIENNQTLLKALILGETKVINGVTHVVKQVGKSGKLDWRVADKKTKSATPAVAKDLNELFDNKDFPTSLADFKFKSNLGGSTGATLVEDANGNQYVLKKGASPAHVEEEFLTNSIYKLMGVDVPVMRIYKENGTTAMISKFIENTTPLNNVIDDQYIDDATEHYVLDCLLANWDIYKNDNILIDDMDNMYRVDNGGGLRFSAQGRDKGAHFTDEVDEIETMLMNNPQLGVGVTNKKLNEQMKKIIKNKKKILDLISDVDLHSKMSMRIASLAMRISNANAPLDPYRDLTDAELEKAMKFCKGDLFDTTDLEGWTFLSQIAKMRGFDGVPTVVPEKDFKKLLKDKDTVFVQRGLTHYDKKSAATLMKEFTTSEHCFYGKQAMYGAGIYAAVNPDKEVGKNNRVAIQYADFREEHILDIILPPDMKIVDGEELDNQMAEEFFGDEFKEAKKEYDEAVNNINTLEKEKETIEKEIETGIKNELGWNEKTYDILRKSRPEEVYADTSKFKFEKILSYFTPILKSINGSIEKIDNLNYNVKLANGSSFLLNRNLSEDVNALKQKSEYSTPYNYQYSLLKSFVVKEHFHDISSKVQAQITEANRTSVELTDIQTKISDSKIAIKTLSDNINTLKTDGSNNMNSIMAKIAKKPGGEFRGFYAAIKGYDAIIQKNGWGQDTDFCVILNRNKVIVKEFKV